MERAEHAGRRILTQSSAAACEREVNQAHRPAAIEADETDRLRLTD